MLHVDLPNRAELLKLIDVRGGPCVSIYVATTPVTEAAQIDRIELKNLLKQAAVQLAAANSPRRDIESIEAAVTAIIEDDEFWAYQANSLAIFVTPDSIRTFRLPNKLTSMVEVSDRFHIKPLLRSVTFPQEAFVLAIGMGSVRLIEISADLPPHPVAVQGMPRDMADALGRRGHSPRDIPGRSGEITSETAMLTRYARTVDAALRPVLSGHEQPMILAANEPLSSVYRSVSSYPHTVSDVISGTTDQTPDHELAALARGILDRVYDAEIAQLRDLFASREQLGRATTDIAQAARAATFGAIDTLLVDMDQIVPGTVADEDGAVTFAQSDDAVTYGVVDEIARRALKSGARVVSARASDIPGGATLAAILRYAI